MKKRFKYAFTRKKETEGGFASLVYGGLSLAVFLICAVLSFVFSGKAG